jgi:hypothetical protein
MLQKTQRSPSLRCAWIFERFNSPGQCFQLFQLEGVLVIRPRGEAPDVLERVLEIGGVAASACGQHPARHLGDPFLLHLFRTRHGDRIEDPKPGLKKLAGEKYL